MATYLVTGAAGFIAARTAEMLLDAGHTVVGLDNLNDYYDVRLKEHRLARLAKKPGFTFARGTIELPPTLEPLFARYRFDAVLNLAARAGVRASIDQPHVYFTTNVTGTLNLLEAMRRHGVKKFVLASSSSLYAGQPTPFREELPVNTPISPYAASKKAAEVLAYSYHHLHGIDVSVLRYFTVYGPAGRPDMGPLRFTRWIDDESPIQLFGDGSQARDFTYIDDIARGTIAALKPLRFEIINLGGGRNPIPVSVFIGKLEALLGKTARYDRKPFHSADMKETWADIAKAERLLGWRPTVGLEEGLQHTVAWYRENRTWLKDVPF
ncbi:MAG TPA: NAD-dependent epimerase/dehydratase family protein [Candidatus Didemnitutus sp.]|nr:NAD-dependent epimerase/dehydratase family protein [Candidatus Didemnitutus sp.]